MALVNTPRGRLSTRRLPATEAPARLDGMSRVEMIRVFAFASVVLTVYVVTGLMALRYVRVRFLRKGPAPSRRWMWTFRVFLALAVAGLACMAYARFVEPYWLEVTRVRLESAELWVAGIAAGDEHLVPRALRGVPEGAFVLFLYHAPALVLDLAERKVDLVCCGHTHGGQVALPFYGALVTLSSTGKRFEAGLYRVKETWLYVNRGVGMEGGPVPRVRFCARPEVTVFELCPAP